MKLLSFLVMFSLLVTSLTAGAVHPRTAPQADPAVIQLKRMVRELRALVRRGKNANAADRWFLRELRRLARKYDQPLYRILFRDDFRDGNYSRSPVWVVTEGSFQVSQQHALTSLTVHAAPEKKRSFKDALRDKLRRQLGREDKRPPAMIASTSAIYSSVSVPAAFEIRYQLVPHRVQGRAVMHLYQGRNRHSGFRLVYRPREGRWLLRYYNSKGRRDVLASGTYNPHVVINKPHEVHWKRDRKGVMTVSVNGISVISVRDGRISAFSGIEYKNHNGEFALHWITIREEI